MGLPMCVHTFIQRCLPSLNGSCFDAYFLSLSLGESTPHKDKDKERNKSDPTPSTDRKQTEDDTDGAKKQTKSEHTQTSAGKK